MKAVIIPEFYQSLDQVHVSKIPQPIPEDDELLIRVEAAGVNFVDTLYVRGKHQNNQSQVVPPFTLGVEFAGTVISAPRSSGWKPGDQVFGDKHGSYAEYIVLPVAAAPLLHRVPKSWSPAEAAGLGATLPVSYGSLVLAGGLKAGETVLVHSAAGGLGIMAVQIAKALGCRVISTAGSEAKCEYVRSFGASECFDYCEADWWKRILEATDNKGVDVVFDPVGLVDLSLKCIAHRGRLLIIGFVGREGNMERVAMNRLLLKQVSLIGYRFGETLRRYPEERLKIWRELRPLIAEGKIKSTVFKKYEGLESVPQALRDLADREVHGKAVIQIGEADHQSSPQPKL